MLRCCGSIWQHRCWVLKLLKLLNFEGWPLCVQSQNTAPWCRTLGTWHALQYYIESSLKVIPFLYAFLRLTPCSPICDLAPPSGPLHLCHIIRSYASLARRQPSQASQSLRNLWSIYQLGSLLIPGRPSVLRSRLSFLRIRTIIWRLWEVIGMHRRDSIQYGDRKRCHVWACCSVSNHSEYMA